MARSLLRRLKDCNSCPQPRFPIIKKCDYERVPFERLLDDCALDPAPAAVYEPDVAKASRIGLRQVLVDQGRNVPGREGVKVERGLDWNANRVLILHGYFPGGRAPGTRTTARSGQ